MWQTGPAPGQRRGCRFLVLYADPVDVDLFEGDDRWTVAFAVQNRRRRRGPGRLAVISRRWAPPGDVGSPAVI